MPCRRERGCSSAATAAPDAGHFFEPTVLVDVDHTMKCMTEETFGPTLPIMKVRDDEEAVRLANDSPYGLGGVGLLARHRKGEAIARRIDSGAANVNDAMINYTVAGAADGRRQGLRARLAPRRGRHPQVLLSAGDRGHAEPGAEEGTLHVPLQVAHLAEAARPAVQAACTAAASATRIEPSSSAH